MPRVLISYRREDTSGHAAHLYDILAEHFGTDQVFRDIDTIAPGDDFVEIIEKSIGAADVLIALIGRDWLSAVNADGVRRLDDPEDFVRLELAKALERNVRIVPVLVQGATMPAAKDLPETLRALARRNAFTISDQAFRRDASALIEALERVVHPSATPAAGVRRALTPKRAILVAAALVVVVGGAVAVRELGRRGDRDATAPTRQRIDEQPPVATAPVAPPRASKEPAAPVKTAAQPPVVIYPPNHATIPQPFTRAWEFRWAPARPGQAATYDVTLGRDGMTREPYKTTTTATSWDPRLCGIAGPAVRGWWLKVKSTLSDGSATETVSRFDVAPTDFATFCGACPEYPSCASRQPPRAPPQ